MRENRSLSDWHQHKVRSYRRCDSLDDHVFVHHATISHSQGQEEEDTSFVHVVERDYVLRLCPCGKKSGQAGRR